MPESRGPCEIPFQGILSKGNFKSIRAKSRVYQQSKDFMFKERMNLNFFLYCQVLAIFFKYSNGVCYGSTNYATTSLRSLSRRYYSNNEYCTFYIQPSSYYTSSSYYLEIKWISFNIEGLVPSCYDYVEVFLTRYEFSY